MAIKVVTGQQTFVKKIVVGTPISTAQTGLSIDNFSDFKVSTKSEGQILVYDSAEAAFKNYTLIAGNGLEKLNTPGTDKLALQIDSSSTPVMTGLTTLGHIVPAADSTVDLGDSAKKFRDLYLSGGTIHLGNIDLKDSSGGFAATDSTGSPVNLNLQGSIPQIRRMFTGGGDLSYDTGTGVFQFDVEQVYTKANFDSDFNVTLDSAVLEGVGLSYNNATNTLSIDSAELSANFRQDIRGYLSASNTLNYNSATGDFSLPQTLGLTDSAKFRSVDADSSSIQKLRIPDLTLHGTKGQVLIGTGADGSSTRMAIYHNGTNAYFQNRTGDLNIDQAPSDNSKDLNITNFSNDGDVIIKTDNGSGNTTNYIIADGGTGEVQLYHYGSEKLNTTDSGINVTGSILADSATISKVSGDSARFTRISGVYQGFDSDLARTTSTQTIRGYVSATDGGGDGSFAYNSSTGVFTYTGPSASEVRAHITGGSGIGDSVNGNGVIKIDSSELYTLYKHDDFSDFVTDEHVAHSGVSITAGTGLTGGGNIAATRTLNVIGGKGIIANADDIQVDSSNIKKIVSATDAGGDGSFSYNNSTGVFTYTGPSASEVRAHITGGSGIGDSVNGNGVVKIDSAELYSLYKHDDFSDFVADEHVAHTGVSIVAGKGLTGGGNIASSRTIDIDSANVRGMVSATDAGGDGSFSYNSGTGAFTYTGPSAAEVKAHFQPLDSSANPTFNQLRGPAELIIDPAAIGDATGTVKIMGNLQVEGTQTTINSSTIILKDKNIVIADSAVDSSALNGAGFTWGDSAIVSNPTFNYNHSNARFVSNREINAPLFSGSGASLTALPAASLTGTIDSARIPALLIADIGNITAIDHDALTNFVANEHIDHTAVSITAGNGLTGGGTIASTRNIAIDSSQLANLYSKVIVHDNTNGFVANEHIDHTGVSITAGNGLAGGGTIASTRSLAIDSSQLASLYSKVIVHDNTNGFVANEHIDHTTVSVIAGKGLSGGGTIASNRTIDIDSANVRGMFSGGSGIGDSVNGNGIIKIDSAELYSLYKHDDFADFVSDEHVAHTSVSIATGDGLSGGGTIASTRTLKIDSSDLAGLYSKVIVHDNTSGFVSDEHVAHTGVSIVAGKGLTGGGNIASSRTIDIDSANVRGMFSAGGDLSYNSGTGQFSFDVEAVYTKANFDSDYILAKDSANSAVERNKHSTTTKNFSVTVASKVAHVYQGQGSGQAYFIDGTESPIVNLKLGRTYRFTLSSSDMSSHPFRFYYDAARTTQYTTGVTTTSTYAEIVISEATPPVLHYQCSSHGYMGHALQISTRNFTGFTTTNLTEGTNLYYTDGRFDTRLAAKTTDNLTEGSSNLYYTNARVQAISLDSAEAQSMIDSNFANGDSATFAGNIRADGGNLIMGDEAFSTNASYIGMKTSNMTNANDYMMISGTSDGTTYVSAKTGSTTRIRAGGNVATHEFVVSSTGAFFLGDGLFDSAGAIMFDKSDKSLKFGDKYKAKFGNSGDLQIFHDGHSYIQDQGGGFLKLQGTTYTVLGFTDDTEAVVGQQGAGVNLRYNNNIRLQTTDSGATITGELTADSATIGGLRFPKVDGLNNQVIKTDGSGNLSFVSVAAISGAIDSANVIALIDSSYVQARQTGGAITVQEEGSALSTAATTLNFVGTSVTATGSGATKTITISSGTDSSATQAMIDSSIGFQVDSAYVQARQVGSAITIQEEGSSLSTAASTLNFVGSAVTATGSGATKTITITGSSATTGTINNVKADAFTGDASTKTFALSNAPADSDDVLVFVNGVLQHTNTYSISGLNLTLDSAPDSSSQIEARTHLLQSTNLILRDHKSYVYTLSTNTDSVSGADSAGVTLAYDVGKVDVFANGARLVTGKDFTAANGTSIVFDSAFSSGNVIEVVSHGAATTAELNGILAIDSDLTTTGANQIIYTYTAANHRTLKFTAQLEHDSSSSYHAEEVLLTHNGTTVAMTTYAQVLLDSNLGTFDADINSGNVRLKFSPTKTNTSIKLRAIRTPA